MIVNWLCVLIINWFNKEENSMSAAVSQLSQERSMAQPNIGKLLSEEQQQPPQLDCTTARYHLRSTSHQFFINEEPIPYADQILNLDKFYVIKTHPNSLLKTPIILQRSKQIDALDRRIFTKKFVFEIVKSLEICSFSDAAFICQRIPKQVKYFVTVIQGITQFRWKILIMNDTFYLAFYSCLQSIITKKSLMSPLRKDMLEELLQCNLKSCHSRLFYMLENLVLEHEDLRNTIINLTRNIVKEEMEKKRFFEVHILGENSSQTDDESSEDGENSGVEDNLSTSDHSQTAQESSPKKVDPLKITLTRWSQSLLQNMIKAVGSCLKLKLPREFICSKIINQRLLLIVKQFFKEFFQTQRSTLLKVLTVISEIQPQLMWRIVFQQGKNPKNKNLKFLQLLLTGATCNKTVSLQNDDTYSLIQKLIILPYSPQRRHFLHSILNTFLSVKLTNSQLDCILLFLSQSLREILSDQVPIKAICDMWNSVVRKIERLIYVLKAYNDGGKSNNNVKSNISSVSRLRKKPKQETTRLNPLASLPRIHLPISKSSAITLMKIYKVLIQNQKLFQLQLDYTCIDYLLSLTKSRRGIVEGVRLSLIETIEKGDPLVEEMSVGEEEEQ